MPRRKLANILLVTMLTLNTFAVWHSFRGHRTWNPLGAYSKQVVLNPNETVPVDGELHLQYTKCSGKKPVAVIVTATWEPVGNDPIPVVAAKEVPHTRYPSCGRTPDVKIFDDFIPFPDEVKEQVAQGVTRWELLGTETPVEKGRTGVPRIWKTEPFTITK